MIGLLFVVFGFGGLPLFLGAGMVGRIDGEELEWTGGGAVGMVCGSAIVEDPRPD